MFLAPLAASTACPPDERGDSSCLLSLRSFYAINGCLEQLGQLQEGSAVVNYVS